MTAEDRDCLSPQDLDRVLRRDFAEDWLRGALRPDPFAPLTPEVMVAAQALQDLGGNPIKVVIDACAAAAGQRAHEARIRRDGQIAAAVRACVEPLDRTEDRYGDPIVVGSFLLGEERSGVVLVIAEEFVFVGHGDGSYSYLDPRKCISTPMGTARKQESK